MECVGSAELPSLEKPTTMAANSNLNSSSSSSSSSSEVVVDENKKVLSFCSKRRGSFGWANSQTPFALPFLRLTLPNSNIASEFRTSITTAAHDFFRFLNSLASQNSLLSKILSLPSEFQSLCVQIRCGNSGNMRSMRSHNFAAVLPGDSVAGLVVSNGIQNFLNIYNTLLVVRLVLTWFPNSPPAIVSPLSTICDPYLNIFRGLIPPLGGTLDLSPILAFLVLNVFTSSAAALPAELPHTQHPQQGLAPPSPLQFSQNKWMRRLQGNKSRNSGAVN